MYVNFFFLHFSLFLVTYLYSSNIIHYKTIVKNAANQFCVLSQMSHLIAGGCSSSPSVVQVRGQHTTHLVFPFPALHYTSAVQGSNRTLLSLLLFAKKL